MTIRDQLNKNHYPTTKEIEDNLDHLAMVLEQIQEAYGSPLVITSGLRNEAKQIAIYTQKNKIREAQGLTPIHVPMGSEHLHGRAADVADSDGKFWNWCMINMQLMVELGIYFEDKKSTPTWTHCQTVPPKSGKRIFMP